MIFLPKTDGSANKFSPVGPSDIFTNINKYCSCGPLCNSSNHLPHERAADKELAHLLKSAIAGGPNYNQTKGSPLSSMETIKRGNQPPTAAATLTRSCMRCTFL